MKTITKKPIHKIVQWDCLEVMKNIPDNAIDFICADFPYNISNNWWYAKIWDKIRSFDFGEWDKFKSEKEYLNFVFKTCKEYKRILKPNASAVLFFSYNYAGWIGRELQNQKLFIFKQPIIFGKSNPMPRYKKDSFRSCYEIWIWLINSDKEYAKPKTFNFLEQSVMKNLMYYKIWKDGDKQTNHPTEKPEWLTRILIEVFTNPWDIVLDSFAWWWTTGVASYKSWRNCISIEKEDWFFKMIQERQKRAEMQSNPL